MRDPDPVKSAALEGDRDAAAALADRARRRLLNADPTDPIVSGIYDRMIETMAHLVPTREVRSGDPPAT